MAEGGHSSTELLSPPVMKPVHRIVQRNNNCHGQPSIAERSTHLSLIRHSRNQTGKLDAFNISF